MDDELYKGTFVHLDRDKPAQFEEIVVNATGGACIYKTKLSQGGGGCLPELGCSAHSY